MRTRSCRQIFRWPFTTIWAHNRPHDSSSAAVFTYSRVVVGRNTWGAIQWFHSFTIWKRVNFALTCFVSFCENLKTFFDLLLFFLELQDKLFYTLNKNLKRLFYVKLRIRSQFVSSIKQIFIKYISQSFVWQTEEKDNTTRFKPEKLKMWNYVIW